ncbi:carboxypeptidase-like regulatory domain-containing protein [Demequina phytophila]|uniref:carboxypeptidase-like regulatory domain-containing protein n=1 Tax=Demequina phytophila TaxID=1638981 RepID=UPI000786514B|nr:carboxypeptidase-like regulatory domain-containing protein [Demequina phytophila]
MRRSPAPAARARSVAAAWCAAAALVAALLAPAAPAVAATGATISGTVRAPAGADPGWHEHVRVWATSSVHGSRVAFVDADGTYAIEDLEPGEYRVRFAPQPYEHTVGWPASRTDLLTEFFPDARTYDLAAELTVEDGGGVTGIDARLEATGSIAGAVSVPEGTSERWQERIEVVGDWGGVPIATDGTYLIQGLAPGAYAVEFSPYGHAWSDDAPYPDLVTEWHPGAYVPADAVPVPVGVSEAVTGVDIALDRTASVTGTVSAPAGAPADWWRNVDVQLIRPGGWDLEPIDAEGRYEFTRLAPGVHTVCALVDEDLDLLASCHGGDVAAALTLAHGTARGGADITLRASAHIAGTVSAPEYNDPWWTHGVTVYAVEPDTAKLRGSSPVGPDGRYDIRGLTTGEYAVRFVPGSYVYTPTQTVTGTTLRPEYHADAAALGDATRITAAEGTTADGIDAVLEAPAFVPFDTAPAPTLGGDARVGATVTAEPGTWSPANPRLTFRWRRDGVEIAGATGRSYTPTAADAHAALTVDVAAFAPGRIVTTRTSAKVTVAPATFTTAPVPTVSGTPIVDRTLTVAPGTWSPAPMLTYQWRRDGAGIAGATAPSYLLTAADAGAAIDVTVTATRPGFAAATRTSASSTVVAATFAAAPAPRIAGTPRAGRTLTARVGTWEPSPALRFRWYRDGTAIRGATDRTYAVTTADRGATLTVAVTGTRPGYTTTTRISSGIAVPRVFARAPRPSLAGTPRVGTRLTARTGTWNPTPTFTYRWWRGTTPIKGATRATYVPVRADRGRAVHVTVTASKRGYVTRTRASESVRVP